MEDIFIKYKELVPTVSRIQGPYYRSSDGRNIVILTLSCGKKTTTQYAKVLLEIKLGRVLGKDETVDHIDENKLNDQLDNLRLLTRKQNASRSTIRRKIIKDRCIWCNKEFELTKAQIGKILKAGPFCSRSCSGQYGKSIQNGGVSLDRNNVNVEYFKLSDNGRI